jgi:phosphate transport system permease protein
LFLGFVSPGFVPGDISAGTVEDHPFDQSAICTSVIAGEMGEVPHGSMHYHALFAVGFVLLVIVTVLNISGDFVRAAIKKKFGGY